jgi:secondary thiamine-phosphate synthase enzyme
MSIPRFRAERDVGSLERASPLQESRLAPAPSRWISTRRRAYWSAMMRQAVETLTVRTRGRGFYEITRDVQSQVRQAGLQTGLCTLHLQHTSASLLIQENADPDVRRDFERFFARLVPDGDPLFVHTMEGDDDMPAHVRTALTAVNLSIPIAEGRLCLGTWQGIYVWEHRTAPHTRAVVVHVMGDGDAPRDELR